MDREKFIAEVESLFEKYTGVWIEAGEIEGWLQDVPTRVRRNPMLVKIVYNDVNGKTHRKIVAFECVTVSSK